MGPVNLTLSHPFNSVKTVADLSNVDGAKLCTIFFCFSSVLCNARSDVQLQSVIHFINEVLAGMPNTHTA